MEASGFIAQKLRFKGGLAVVSIAVSFVVMIIAISVTSGFKREIGNGISSLTGDIQLLPADMNYINEDNPVNVRPSYMDKIEAVPGVGDIRPVIYRAGIVKSGDNIHGVVFKAWPGGGDSLKVSVPVRLADMLGLHVGDRMLTYFIGEKVKVRNFTVADIYSGMMTSDDELMVFGGIDDFRRLNGWSDDEASLIEIKAGDKFRSTSRIEELTSHIGAIVAEYATDDDDYLMALSAMKRYPRIFSWLDLIDYNVFIILVLMTIVAGFNMISGLLIILFRNISTIGLLKSLGMTDREISKVFLKVSSNIVLKGMAVGNVIAVIFCVLQGMTHLISLNPENYFLSFVPVHLDMPFILIADAVSYLVIMLLLQLPCIFVSRVDPAVTLRSN